MPASNAYFKHPRSKDTWGRLKLLARKVTESNHVWSLCDWVQPRLAGWSSEGAGNAATVKGAFRLMHSRNHLDAAVVHNKSPLWFAGISAICLTGTHNSDKPDDGQLGVITLWHALVASTAGTYNRLRLRRACCMATKVS
jgi:hypothetical protein